MAFVNAYLTEEEKKAFEEAKIPDPKWGVSKYLLKPSRWTIDRERGIALINCGVADRENYEIETFAFINIQLEKKEILSFEIKGKYLSEEEENPLMKMYNVDMVKKWKVLKIKKLDKSEIVNSHKDFLELLSKALSAYGISGNPNSKVISKALVELDN